VDWLSGGYPGPGAYRMGIWGPPQRFLEGAPRPAHHAKAYESIVTRSLRLGEFSRRAKTNRQPSQAPHAGNGQAALHVKSN